MQQQKDLKFLLSICEEDNQKFTPKVRAQLEKIVRNTNRSFKELRQISGYDHWVASFKIEPFTFEVFVNIQLKQIRAECFYRDIQTIKRLRNYIERNENVAT